MTAAQDRATLKTQLDAQYQNNGTNDIQAVNARTASNLVADFVPARTLLVASEGGDYTTIAAAIAAVTAPTQANAWMIIVQTGTYVEVNPLTIPEFTTIQGQGTVVVVATTPTSNIFNMSSNSSLRDIAVFGAIGVGAKGVYCTASGNQFIENLTIIDCFNGILVDETTASVTARNIQILSTGVNTVTSAFDIIAGNVDIRNVRVGQTTKVNTLLKIAGANSDVVISDVKSFSPDVTNGLACTVDCTVNADNLRFTGVTNGISCKTGAQVRVNNATVLTSTLGVILDNATSLLDLSASRILNSATLNMDLIEGTLIGSGITTDTTLVQVDETVVRYAQFIDLQEGDEAVAVYGEMHVGTSLAPAESVFGAGDSHTFEHVYTFDGTSTYTDRTTAAKSFSGSTFTFDGVTAGNEVLIANRFPLTFEGIKVSIETAAVLGAGEIVAEYWNGSSWVEFNGCTSLADAAYYKYAKNYFSQTGNYHIKYNPFIRTPWQENDPVSLGETFYWMKYRVATTITTAPVFQQIKIHTNRAEINQDGTQEFHMDARTYKKLVVDAIKPIEGSMQSQDIYVDENVGIGLENNRFTATGDILGVSFELPEDCDTSAPLIFVWKGKFASTGNVNFTVRRKIVAPGDAYTNSEPGASGETLVVTTGSVAVSTSDTREDFRVDIDISDAIPSRTGSFGDEIWITLQYPTRGAGNFDYTKLSANYLSDFNGRHIRQ